MDSINNKTENTINKLWVGTFIVFVMLITAIIILSNLLYALKVNAVYDNTKGPGSPLTAAEWNELPTELGAPFGIVVPFNLPACPAGWSPADGGGGLPDLRGAFIRGLDPRPPASGRDPDGPRSLRSYQADDFQSHRHSLPPSNGNIALGSSISESWPDCHQNLSTGYDGDTETRPKNVALIYCVKN